MTTNDTPPTSPPPGAAKFYVAPNKPVSEMSDAEIHDFADAFATGLIGFAKTQVAANTPADPAPAG